MRLVLAATALGLVAADTYLHNPRGSNNRLDDENRDRNNANRLFDSQNNNRGGSNVGQVYYYAGSKVPMEWSVQHSCGNPNNNCEVIIQTMCEERVRDGTTTETIPINPNECYNWDCDTDVRFGRHESFDYYMECKYRMRNRGLFTSSQNLNGNSAIYTRQNPNGNRRGLECPEERDYYPYWGPTPWRDVAILTNQPSRCAAYQAESQNVKSRWKCALSNGDISGFMNWHNDNTIPNGEKTLLPLDELSCQNINYYDKKNNETVFGQWTEVPPVVGLTAPACVANMWSRDNHHGNVEGGEWTGYDWTVPSWMVHERCVLRLRYNISTGDIPHLDPNAITTSDLNSSNNKAPGGHNQVPAKVDIGSFYGIPNSTMMNRDYTLRNNPRPDLFGNSTPVPLQLAINTAQYGRTFEDRTHRFAVRDVPESAEFAGKDILNIQVRGKRGNVVQTYPGTEYDFTPNTANCQIGSFVHFQWTGSNTNPNNNAGQGRQGTDRHNVIGLRRKNYDEPMLTDQPINGMNVFGHYGNSYPMKIQEWSFLGLSEADMQHLAILDTAGGQFGGELSELDDAGTYFDLGPRQCTAAGEGVYHYMCTRNNNFSNRSQKGKITVSALSTGKLVLSSAPTQFLMAGLSIATPADATNGVSSLEISSAAAEGTPGFTTSSGIDPISDIVKVAPFTLNPGKSLTLTLPYTAGALTSATLYTAQNAAGPWTEVSGYTNANSASTGQITTSGYFAVGGSVNGGAVAGIVLGVLFICAVIGYVVYKKKQASNSSNFVGTQNHI